MLLAPQRALIAIVRYHSHADTAMQLFEIFAYPTGLQIITTSPLQLRGAHATNKLNATIKQKMQLKLLENVTIHTHRLKRPSQMCTTASTQLHVALHCMHCIALCIAPLIQVYNKAEQN